MSQITIIIEWLVWRGCRVVLRAAVLSTT